MRILEKDLLKAAGLVNVFAFEEKEIHDYHTHDFYEIKYIESGAGAHALRDGAEESLSPGNIIFITKGVEHSLFSSNVNDKMNVINIIFDDRFIDSFQTMQQEGESVPMVFPKEIKDIRYFKLRDDDATLKEIVYKMLEECNEKSEGYINLMQAYLFELVLIMLRKYRSQWKAKKVNRYVGAVTTYTEQHFGDNITLDTLAAVVHLSPNYLCRIFKRETGISVIQYVQELKIQKACALLENTDKTFNEITYELGYESVNYLRNIFKKEIGLTPSAYREQYKKSTERTS